MWPPGPRPSCVAFHGFSSDAVEQEALSRISQVADEKGFIAVYPFGFNFPEALRQDGGTEDTRSWNAGGCCGPAQIYGVNDVDFVDALFADLDKRVCVDTRRTYATGLSNGGFFAYRLACDRAAPLRRHRPRGRQRERRLLHPHPPRARACTSTAPPIPTISYDGGSSSPSAGPTPPRPTRWRSGPSATAAPARSSRRTSRATAPAQTHSGCTAPATALHRPRRRPHLARRPDASRVRLHHEGSGRHA